MAFLEISNLQKHFADHHAVKDFSLTAEQGEFVTFLGPSGCGKTTILRMLAGFEAPSTGSIVMDGRDITSLRTSQRNIGMVFQSYALFPNMTVAENIGFGLRVAKMPRPEIDARVNEMLELVHLGALANRYPWQMSGGQQQRVALARAISNKPKILLLDEPLSALDAKIRISLREEIRTLQRALNITTVFVTHDQEEALSISDRVVVFHEGRVEQIGTPLEIYNFPRTRFVASFVGTLNQLPCVVVDPAVGSVRVGDQTLAGGGPLAGLAAGDAAMVAIRPEAIRIQRPQDANTTMNTANTMNSVNATVDEVSFLGSIVRIRTRWDGGALSLDVFNDPHQTVPARGSVVVLGFARESLLVLH